MAQRGAKTSPVDVARPGPVPKNVTDDLAAVAKRFGAVPTEDLDTEQIFLLYASFSGDVVRTAHSAGVTPAQVIELAEKHKWLSQINGLIELKKNTKPGTVEKEMSRAMNFVQAHKYRVYLERVLRKVMAMSDADLFKFLVADRFDKNGKVTGQVFSTRPLADLASALEKVHWMTYQALGDTPQDRMRAKEKVGDDETSAMDIHAKIAKALASMPSLQPQQHLVGALKEQAVLDGAPFVPSVDEMREQQATPVSAAIERDSNRSPDAEIPAEAT